MVVEEVGMATGQVCLQFWTVQIQNVWRTLKCELFQKKWSKKAQAKMLGILSALMSFKNGNKKRQINKVLNALLQA